MSEDVLSFLPENALSRADTLHNKSRKRDRLGEELIGQSRLDKHDPFLVICLCARDPVEEQQFLFRPLRAPFTAHLFNFDHFFHMGIFYHRPRIL